MASAGHLLAFGIVGLAASKANASLAVELVDGRVCVFYLYAVSSPQLMGVLSKYGLFHRKKD
jgi:hypothetical protein